jgi:adenylate cyclase
MAEKPVQRRLAAILAADVVGYSRLMGQDEAGTLADLKARRKDVLEPVVARHRGRIFKVMGDGVFVEFGSAVNAVQCAVELQQGMAAANSGLPEDRRIVLRIGVNLGDVMVEGSDLYGDGVNIAARLEAVAEPGGICISAKVHDEVRNRLRLSFDDLGEQEFKNIATAVRAYRVGWEAHSDQLRSQSRPQPRTRDTLPLPTKPSIAVLAFENMSGDPDQEYFADGMVEEIITALSRMRWLFVIARNSSFAYKGRSIDVKQIGQELGVRYILEGSVRKAGSRVRITGQLIDAATGAHLWADRFDGGLDDIFDLQDQVTASVVGAIAPKLELAEIERSRRKPTENLDAYDHYLRGLAGVYQWTKKGNDDALSNLYRAIELDPAFASAYGLTARCYSQRWYGGWVTDRPHAVAEAERLAVRAAVLGKDDAVALAMAGFALADFVGRLEDGDALITQALALNANLAWAWYYSGWVKASLGEPEAAIEHVTRAMRLSPNDPQMFGMHTALGFAHFVAGRYAQALAFSEAAARAQPEFPFATCLAAASAALAGQLEIAQRSMATLRQLAPGLRLSNLRSLQPIRRPEDYAKWEQGMRLAGLPEN